MLGKRRRLRGKTFHFFPYKPYWIRLWYNTYPEYFESTQEEHYHIHVGWSIGWIECEFSI